MDESASVLFEPLDRVLGRSSQVRVLRALSLHGPGLTPPELARRTGLSRGGVWKALARLEELDVVEPVGVGHTVPYRMSPTHPIAQAINILFGAEAGRADGVLAAICSAAALLEPQPLAVWIFGSVARAEDRPESDLDIAVVADNDTAARSCAAQLRDALSDPAERWAVRPSVISLSLAELEKLHVEGGNFWIRLVKEAIPLVGPPPNELIREQS